MRAKNIYQCDENCKNCTHQDKKSTGFTDLDECLAENCPSGNYRAGRVDRLGGRHEDGYGWNPLGEFCNLCKYETCEGCVKWGNRDKKLRNAIPPELRTTKEKKTPPATSIPGVPKQEESVVSKLQKMLEEEQSKKQHNPTTQIIKAETQEEEIEIEPVPYIPMASCIDEIDFGDDKNTETQETMGANNVSENVIEQDAENDAEDIKEEVHENQTEPDDDFLDFDEVDVGDDDSDFAMDNDEYTSNEDDDIPPPADIDMPFGDTASTEDEPLSAQENDDEDDDEDEDDDAEFQLFEPTKKLKASILFKPDTKIATYKVRDKGVMLLIQGDAKVIVKGRDDSDGFAYCDPSKFPRYIREGILSGELYKNPNIKIEDGSYFSIVYYQEVDGELVQKASEKCSVSFANTDEDKVRNVLKKAFNRLSR